MNVLVTGSSGLLGAALVRSLKNAGHAVSGLDIRPGPETTHAGSIIDRGPVRKALEGIEAVVHTATLQKPDVATHSKSQFVDTNIHGTLNLLEESVASGVSRFLFTSTTSLFGDAMLPGDSGRAVWVTEELHPVPKNIYGVTKAAAEDLCHLFYRKHGLPCLVLRTSRFFLEEDDMDSTPSGFSDENIKANEYLFRRVSVADAVSAHIQALGHAEAIGFDRFIITATTPFSKEDCPALYEDAPSVVKRYFPGYEERYAKKGWDMFSRIGRVYVNSKARKRLGWRPRDNFQEILNRIGPPVPASRADQ